VGRVSLLCFCGNSIAGPTGQERHEENKIRHPPTLPQGATIQKRLVVLLRYRSGWGDMSIGEPRKSMRIDALFHKNKIYELRDFVPPDYRILGYFQVKQARNL
jgi:hypothetical protein